MGFTQQEKQRYSIQLMHFVMNKEKGILTKVSEFFGAYWRYLKSPKGHWDTLNYTGLFLIFVLFFLLVIWGGYQLELVK